MNPDAVGQDHSKQQENASEECNREKPNMVRSASVEHVYSTADFCYCRTPEPFLVSDLKADTSSVLHGIPGEQLLQVGEDGANHLENSEGQYTYVDVDKKRGRESGKRESSKVGKAKMGPKKDAVDHVEKKNLPDDSMVVTYHSRSTEQESATETQVLSGNIEHTMLGDATYAVVQVSKNKKKTGKSGSLSSNMELKGETHGSSELRVGGDGENESTSGASASSSSFASTREEVREGEVEDTKVPPPKPLRSQKSITTSKVLMTEAPTPANSESTSALSEGKRAHAPKKPRYPAPPPPRKFKVPSPSPQYLPPLMEPPESVACPPQAATSSGPPSFPPPQPPDSPSHPPPPQPPDSPSHTPSAEARPKPAHTYEAVTEFSTPNEKMAKVDDLVIHTQAENVGEKKASVSEATGGLLYPQKPPRSIHKNSGKATPSGKGKIASYSLNTEDLKKGFKNDGRFKKSPSLPPRSSPPPPPPPSAPPSLTQLDGSRPGSLPRNKKMDATTYGDEAGKDPQFLFSQDYSSNLIKVSIGYTVSMCVG